jgi:beta-glucanase (GH16 family)
MPFPPAPRLAGALALSVAACAGPGAATQTTAVDTARGAGSTVAPPAAPPAAPGATVFADEFSGPTLDRAKWLVYTGRVYNSEAQRYTDEPATIAIVHGAEAAGAADGALRIQARHDPGADAEGRRTDFTSGRLHGRMRFRYGTVAARMKLPAGAGLWPAFWLLGEGAWPANGEIDVMENVGDPGWVSVALHGPGYSGNTPLTHRQPFPPGHDATGWHVYAVTWTADSIVFRVDDAPIYRVPRAQVERHGPAAALDTAKFVVLNLALGGEYPAAVNGVRAPYLGLPDASVQRVRAGDATVLVDWVRATQ